MAQVRSLIHRNGIVRSSVPKPQLLGRVQVDGKLFSRSGQRLRVQGVTYGPFAPNGAGEPLPNLGQVRDDFTDMRLAGINAIRTYHAPPAWLLDLADEHELAVFVDIPWPKHLCFLESSEARRAARQAVHQAAARGAAHPSVLAYSIGNEIPPDVIRWHGAGRVERFLAELADVARQADPHGLVTYASYPPTEYLDLTPFDFATFNVYLHDREAFRRYIFRLQNLVGDKPLLLGELGMDTLRHGELEQAQFLSGHLREAVLMGLAGAFVFSWTDDWFTGGHAIEDWAFGITARDRSPKAAYHAVREVFDATPATLLTAAPRVSVVVCTYNGGRTLRQCLDSLRELNYPNYDVIVIDDGSTDDTRAILRQFPDVRVVHQPNAGLSVARNVGLQIANGDIVAYTDSDCFADPEWLTHLVHQVQHTGAAAVGGPNLTPEDGWLAACVAASPGQPTHVLESDQVAEHIPGCNMAFRREALLAINGFDPLYRKAGDDVDVCWRLEQTGQWISFAPGAFVWHHRRQGPRAYLRQQGGYGEAEALLRFKHPDKFNGRGDGKWRGVLYGASSQGLRLGGPIIYRGTFGTGLFQCVYQPGPSHWAMLPSTLEWHALVGVTAVAGLIWPWAWGLAGAMLFLSLLVAALQAAQARLSRSHDGFVSRCVVAGLSYLQPLVRSGRRYKTRLFCPLDRRGGPEPAADGAPLPLSGQRTLGYWTEDWKERTELLRIAATALAEARWGVAYDSGWEKWDLELHAHPWSRVEVRTVQEEHGGGKRLIRLTVRLRASHTALTLGIGGAVALVGLTIEQAVVSAGLVPQLLTATAAAALLAAGALVWARGRRLAAGVVATFDRSAQTMGMVSCSTDRPN
jgi:GT2 family glycosyltransferase